MPPGQLIVLERDGHWAAALRREMGPAAVRLIETRSWDDCWQRVARCPAALVAAELTETNLAEVFGALSRLDRQFPQAAMLIFADRKLAGCRGLVREAGALHFVVSPRRLREVADIVARRWKNRPAAVDPASRSDEILADLPWPEIVE